MQVVYHQCIALMSLVLLQGTLAMAETTLITVPPISFNASLGTTAEFMCTAIDEEGIGITWLVEGANRSTYSPSATGNNMGSFRIQAIEENDGAEVVCRVVSSQDDIHRSDPAVLRVQGLLEAPGHLIVSEQGQTIVLTWEEPPTLDLTDIDPDIDPYTVYITNLNTSQSLSVNVTETKYTFTGLPGETVLNPCSFYQFSVSAWNVVGEGGMSEPAEGHFIDAPPAVVSAEISDLRLNQDGQLEITAKIEVNTSSWCPGNQPDSFSVEVKCAQGCVSYEKWKIYHDLQNDTIYIELSERVDCIPPNDICTVAISSVNEAGSSNSTTTNFSTYDVQRVDVNPSHNSVDVTCHFITGSLAVGCALEFISDKNSGKCSLQVIRANASNVTVQGLPIGTYSFVDVYDIEADGKRSRYPAYTYFESFMVNETSTAISGLDCPSKVTEVDTDSESKGTDFSIIAGILAAAAVASSILIVLVILVLVWGYRKGRKEIAPEGSEEGSVDDSETPENDYTKCPTLKPPVSDEAHTSDVSNLGAVPTSAGEQVPSDDPNEPTSPLSSSDSSSSENAELLRNNGNNNGSHRSSRQNSAAPSSRSRETPSSLNQAEESHYSEVAASQTPNFKPLQQTDVTYSEVVIEK